MHVIAAVVGVALVASVLADLVNTLVNTNTHRARWWLTTIVYRTTWAVVGTMAKRLKNDALRERLLAVFAPMSVLLLLVTWTVQQIVGFGLIWWGFGAVDGADTLGDSIYYSGVVYFTLGFGEVVPVGNWVRAGALIEAFAGVLTTALVIGYLPALYSAFSERERKLMTLDDGSDGRISPASLIVARSPGGDVSQLGDFFKEWEEWITGVIETHSAFPMLMLFRSKHPGQNWVTALGVVTDAALFCQAIRGLEDREPYWCLRRAIILLDELCEGRDLSPYLEALPVEPPDLADNEAFVEQYQLMADHGLDLLPPAVAVERTWELRRKYAAQIEFLIDELIAPRGFWGHTIGHTVAPELRDPSRSTPRAEPPPLR